MFDINNKLCIFTTYLSCGLDPQRNFSFPANFECVFYPLMIGCIQNDIDLFIFHDGSVSSHIEGNITKFNSNIHFVRISPNNTNLSNNDYRFKIYLENFHLSKNFTHVLFSDASDVFIRKNPIQKMDKEKIQICQETSSSFDFFNNHYRSQLQIIKSSSNLDIDSYMKLPTTPLNAGVWGGYIELTHSFLKEYVSSMEDISSSNSKINCNNLLLNIMLKTKNIPIDSSIFSPFKRYAFKDESFYIYHK